MAEFIVGGAGLFLWGHQGDPPGPGRAQQLTNASKTEFGPLVLILIFKCVLQVFSISLEAPHPPSLLSYKTRGKYSLSASFYEILKVIDSFKFLYLVKV